MRHTLLGMAISLFLFGSTLDLRAHQVLSGQTDREVVANRLITYNGVVKDPNGHPRLGIVGITFTLYALQEGGEALWRESQTILTDEQGQYTILLGSTEKAGLPLEVFSSGKAQWLGVQVQGEDEQPRVLLVAVPYALKAADADTLGGKPLSSFVLYEDMTKAVEKPASPAMIVAQISTSGTGFTPTSGSSNSANRGGKVLSNGGTVKPIFGFEAGDNTYFGLDAGHSLGSDSWWNSFFGYHAGYSTTNGGKYNSFFGANAGSSNTTGNYNAFYGYEAGKANTTASHGTFFGRGSGSANTEGSGNTFIGSETGGQNMRGVNNTFVGTLAGRASTANENTFVGSYAGYSNTSAEGNSFFGTSSGYANTTGTGLAFFGAYSGRRNSGINNSFFGYQAGYANIGGDNNAFFGYKAGTANTSGMYNAFFGALAGKDNTTGQYNSFIGRRSGESNISGEYNCAFGYEAGYLNTTGNNNVFVGTYAGDSNTVEDGNNFIGSYSDGAAGITNATAIGYRAKVAQSNSLVLGSISGVNGATADTNVGIGTSNPDRQLVIEGSQALARFTRFKHSADALAPTFAPAFLFERARGTQAAPVDIVAGDYLGKVQFRGRVGGNMLEYGALTFISTDLGQNGRLAFVDRDMLTERVSFLNTGNVGIGTTTPTERLQVAGNLKVSGSILYGASETEVPDYVFESGYRLMPVEDLGKFVAREKHLPNIPKASEIKERGLNLGEFQMKLLEKIEELTLYAVQEALSISRKDADIAILKSQKDAEVAALRSQNAMLEARLAVIEKMMKRLVKTP